MRACAAVAVALFSYAIAVQRNDPDPLFWMAAYAPAAFASLAAVGGLLHTPTLAVVAALYAALFAFMSPALQHMSLEAFGPAGMQSEELEQVREALGLLICLGWSVALLVWSRRV